MGLETTSYTLCTLEKEPAERCSPVLKVPGINDLNKRVLFDLPEANVFNQPYRPVFAEQVAKALRNYLERISLATQPISRECLHIFEQKLSQKLTNAPICKIENNVINDQDIEAFCAQFNLEPSHLCSLKQIFIQLAETFNDITMPRKFEGSEPNQYSKNTP